MDHARPESGRLSEMCRWKYALEKIGERGDGVGKIAREKYTKLN